MGSPRFIIGDTIFDWDGGDANAGTGTYDNVFFRMDPEQEATPTITADSYEWPVFYLIVRAAGEAALKLLVETIHNDIKNISGRAISFENTQGQALIEMPINDFPMAEVEYTPEYADKECVISFKVIGSSPGQSSGGGANGQIDEIQWHYDLAGNQLAGLTAEGVFKPDDSGTEPKTAMQNAQTWVYSLKNNRPTWMPEAMRLVGAEFFPVQVPNQDDVFNPVRARAIFREMPNSLLNLPDSIVDATWSTTVVEGELDMDSNQEAPYQVVLMGTFVVKTEGNTSFSSEIPQAIDPSVIYDEAITGIDIVISNFENIYNRFNLISLGDPTIEVHYDQGRIDFTKVYTTHAIQQWDETTVLLHEEPTTFSRASDGTDWMYEPNGGAIITLQHKLRIVSVGQPFGYSPPSLSSSWYRMRRMQDATIRAARKGGNIVFTTIGSSEWRFVNKTPKGPSSKKTGAGRGQYFKDEILDGDL